MEEIILELKEQIIDVLNLEDMTPEDIDATAPLFVMAESALTQSMHLKS